MGTSVHNVDKARRTKKVIKLLTDRRCSMRDSDDNNDGDDDQCVNDNGQQW